MIERIGHCKRDYLETKSLWINKPLSLLFVVEENSLHTYI